MGYQNRLALICRHRTTMMMKMQDLEENRLGNLSLMTSNSYQLLVPEHLEE
jgi:hypothetical protein